MDVFALRDRVVDDYKRYIESFVRIRDERIEKFVREEFASGILWPDPILQLNPAYEPGPKRLMISLRRELWGPALQSSFASTTAVR